METEAKAVKAGMILGRRDLFRRAAYYVREVRGGQAYCNIVYACNMDTFHVCYTWCEVSQLAGAEVLPDREAVMQWLGGHSRDVVKYLNNCFFEAVDV